MNCILTICAFFCDRLQTLSFTVPPLLTSQTHHSLSWTFSTPQHSYPLVTSQTTITDATYYQKNPLLHLWAIISEMSIIEPRKLVNSLTITVITQSKMYLLPLCYKSFSYFTCLSFYKTMMKTLLSSAFQQWWNKFKWSSRDVSSMNLKCYI